MFSNYLQCFIVLQLIFLIQFSESKDCIGRSYGHGTIVCVCNATYCDTVDPVQPIPVGQYILYTSNKDGLRFKKYHGYFTQQKQNNSEYVVTVNSDLLLQKIFGWGGAFTDSTGFNILSLNKDARQHLLRSYFSNEGIEFSLCRVPIGCSDFSFNYYSYDETPGDDKLKHFNLTKEDYTYKIPFMQEALSLSNNTLKFFGSSWTAPLWMKTNNKPSGLGFLKKEYYQTWADYHIKFLDAYRENGLNFWGITTGNEPILGLSPFFDITSLGWLPWNQGTWIAENLGPTVRNNSKYSSLKIITLDDERLQLPLWLILQTFNNKALNYIDGIGVHWYTDSFLFTFLLTATRFLYPSKFILGTEACTGDLRYKEKVSIGNWRRGEQYIEDIIEDLENYITGWVDWNMALNLKGGPTYVNNFVDSSIIVNASAQEFYKQPTFYTMGHFSKFVPPDSFRIEIIKSSKRLQSIAFKRPDNGIAVVLYNRHSRDLNVTIYDKRRGFINTIIPSRSVNTVVYW